MSISRLRNSRGYSITAALALAAILILAAVAIQSTLPSMTSPASQGAQAAGPTNSGTAGTSNTTTPTIAQCPTKLPADPYITKEGDGTKPQNCACKVTDSKTGKTTIYGTHYKVTPLLQQGNQVTQTQLLRVVPPNGTAIRCEVEVCATPTQTNCDVRTVNVNGDDVNSANAQLQSMLSQATQDSSKNYLHNLATDLAAGNQLPGPISAQTKSNLSDELNAVYQQDKSTDALNCTPDYVSGGMVGACGASNGTLQAKDAIENLANTKTCGDTSCPDPNASNPNASAPGVKLNDTSVSGLTPPDPNKPYYLQQVDENGKSVWCDQNGNCKPADTFTPPQSQGGPPGQGCTGIGPPDANGNCPKVPPNTTTFPPTSAPPPPSSAPSPNNSGNGGGLANILGNLFGNNNSAANNTPQSPFGGACTNRYVCQGNTLYYQTVSGGIISGNQIIGQQCQTMPVQQCQYGCQAINTTGTNSTLSDIGTGLQFASQLLRIFSGGGSTNSNVVNPNLASQCAMTPQQAQGYQSPYGTGTNGQPCYQPPQSPDPSQCTSGTWQPTSAQQNGCTTGYQCVPNSSQNNQNTQPSAQLSCQPQIADVGMPISFSFSCGNSDASKASGFSTGGALSGATSTPAPLPPAGSNQASFTLTCLHQGVTASAQCQVQLNKPGIVLITNPQKVNSGDTALIGWVTAGMQSCVISSPDDQNFNARNAGNTSANGAATTSPITATTNFRLDCQTLSGATKFATTSVSVH